MGLFEELFFVRLSEPDRKKLMKEKGASTFAPMIGRPMKEYVVVPPAILKDKAKLKSWVKMALAFGQSLPPK